MNEIIIFVSCEVKFRIASFCFIWQKTDRQRHPHIEWAWYTSLHFNSIPSHSLTHFHFLIYLVWFCFPSIYSLHLQSRHKADTSHPSISLYLQYHWHPIHWFHLFTTQIQTIYPLLQNHTTPIRRTLKNTLNFQWRVFNYINFITHSFVRSPTLTH